MSYEGTPPTPTATAKAVTIVTAVKEEPVPDHRLAEYVELLVRKFNTNGTRRCG